MSRRKIYPYARSHTTYGHSTLTNKTNSFASVFGLNGASSQPYSRPSFTYLRTWTGFPSVVAIHPSQLRREKRYHLEKIPERVEQLEVPRVRRVSSTIWETPK